MKRLLDERGSTLMLILITTAILTMLGTALLSMSLMNITMKANEKRIQGTQYLTESGIDQVYGYVGKFVEDAIGSAISSTDSDMTTLLSALHTEVSTDDNGDGVINMTDVTGDITISSVTVTKSDYLNADLSLNISALETFSNERYKFYFKDYLDTIEQDVNVANRISGQLNAASYTNVEPGGSLVITVSTADADVDRFGEGDPSLFVLRNISSEFTYQGTKKQITTDIVITDEITSYPLNTVENRIKIKDNPLWQQAMVAMGDIEVQGSGKLDVEGNVYGYGNEAATVVAGGNKNDADPTEFGGVIFSGTSASTTTIDGNLYSREYIQLKGTGTKSFTLTNGAIYTDTLIAQKNANGSMVVNGNVYTSDDLELNGKNASIRVEGSYYGYTDGSTSRVNTASSAIVINSDVYADNPSLIVTGVAPAGTQIHTETTSGVMIGGTGYIDEVVDTVTTPGVNARYQMAESLAFRENSLPYTWAFSSALIDLVKALDPDDDPVSGINGPRTGPYVAETGSLYAFYSDDATQDDRIERYLNKDNVKWHSVTASANLAVGTIDPDDPLNPDVDINPDDPANPDYDFGELSEKKAIFATFQDQVDPTGVLLNQGNGKVQVSNYIYTTGLQLNASSGKFIFQNAAQATFDSLRVKIKEDYLYQLHNLSLRNGVDIWDAVNPDEIDDAVIEYLPGSVEPTVDNANPVAKYSKIDEPSYGITYDGGSETADYDGAAIAYNINDASADDLYIYGGAGTNTANALYLNNSTKRLIVVRRGDVYLSGTINVEGAIITEGSIYILDGADVTIDNLASKSASAKETLARFIYQVDTLKDVFDVSVYSTASGIDVNLTDLEFNSVVTSSFSYDPNNNSVFTYYDWIYFDHWKVAY